MTKQVGGWELVTNDQESHYVRYKNGFLRVICHGKLSWGVLAKNNVPIEQRCSKCVELTSDSIGGEYIDYL